MPPQLSPRVSSSSVLSACPGPVGVPSVVNPSCFLLLNFGLSTGHPAKDAHPEGARRGGQVEGSLRPFSFFLLFLNSKLTTYNCELPFSPNSNHSRTYGPFSRKSNHSRTYENRGGGRGVPFRMRCSIQTRLFSLPVLTM